MKYNQLNFNSFYKILNIKNIFPSNFLSSKNIMRKLIINFSVCYLFYNLNSKFINTSKDIIYCQNKGFWSFGSTDSIELNNLEKRATALQHNSNNPVEDRYTAAELKNFPGYFISVLDGHGGHNCAEYANQRLLKYFDNYYKDLKESNKKLSEDELVTNALLKTFARIEQEYYVESRDLYQRGEGRAATVGSCVLISIISSNKIYTAQLGDSKAKLFRKNKSTETGYERIKLTNTHNSEKKHQQDILYKEFPNENDIVVCKRPNNKVCYVKGRLQPTRSLGDFHLKFHEFNTIFEKSYKRPVRNFNGPYIKSIPEIKIVEINKDDEYLVMGTDGLWDFLDSKDVTQIIKDNNDGSIKNIANSLFTEVMNRAARDARMTVDRLMSIPPGKKRNLHDDITFIVFDLKH
jgi:pyruvate dehydrogenase phosphatase